AADTPQRLLTYYARKYLEAELAITGVTDGDARALLEEAIRASFDKVDEIAAAASAPALVEEDVEAYIAAVLERYDAADAEGKLEHIMTQKWIATYGFGVDAYTDYRRTGYPKLHDPNTDNLNVTASARLYPLAFPYPQSELNRNPNAPGQRNITTDGVFWDK
ncbi:MAG: SusD/RagB family nutrient-binding outer membrane lipoprotein, partial [Phaeodactylibacter sp.]|nr:SusD/RagB family nutrient-binding outer membrane lipoprotein [Phaeodactylibacter sp.]